MKHKSKWGLATFLFAIGGIVACGSSEAPRDGAQETGVGSGQGNTSAPAQIGSGCDVDGSVPDATATPDSGPELDAAADAGPPAVDAGPPAIADSGSDAGTCGATGQACCTGNTCAPGNVCYPTGDGSNYCTPCGGQYGFCCGAAAGGMGTCNDGMICGSRSPIPPGGVPIPPYWCEPPCTDTSCPNWSVCSPFDHNCYQCGGYEQPCCPSPQQACQSDLHCGSNGPHCELPMPGQ